LSVPFRPQYNAGGPDALIDGRRGGPSYRLGRWQGYQGTDLDATVDLGDVRDVRRVTIGFLQDAGAWILMPREVVFLLSDDGGSYREVGRSVNTVPATESGVVTRDFAADVPAQRARYVRVRVTGAGPLPAGHPGEGEPSWFFADEIIVEP